MVSGGGWNFMSVWWEGVFTGGGGITQQSAEVENQLQHLLFNEGLGSLAKAY